MPPVSKPTYVGPGFPHPSSAWPRRRCGPGLALTQFRGSGQGAGNALSTSHVQCSTIAALMRPADDRLVTRRLSSISEYMFRFADLRCDEGHARCRRPVEWQRLVSRYFSQLKAFNPFATIARQTWHGSCFVGYRTRMTGSAQKVQRARRQYKPTLLKENQHGTWQQS